MPNIIHRIKLCFEGRPFILKYRLNCSKEEFKKYIIQRIAGDDLDNPFAFSPPKFVGNIKGLGRDEFEVKANSSIWNKGSIHSSAWFYLTTKETDSNYLELKVEAHRSKLVRRGIWGISLLFLLIFIGSTVGILAGDNSKNSFIIPFVILGFHLFILIIISSISSELEYFQDHLTSPLGGELM